jgi:DASS family divalent anion:Na+ symporter
MFYSLRNNAHFRQALALIAIILVGLGFSLLPTPYGVSPKAYPTLGIFISLIFGILLKPYPTVVLTLSGLFIAIIAGLVEPNEGFRCFGESVLWLIAFASIAAKSFVKTNLGERLACFFLKKTGKNSLSLAYGLVLSEVALSPMIPSNTARAACVSIPLAVSVSESLGSSPKDKTENLIGRFLNLCNMQANQLTSALFLTSIGSNPVALNMMAKLGVSVSWGEWFFMACLPCGLCILAIPLLMYFLAPPELKKIPQAVAIAQRRLDEMSTMKPKEIITLCVFICMLLLWIFGDKLGLPTAVVALGGLCALLITGVLSVDDICGAKDIWNILIWLAIFILLAGKLTEYGLVQYYSKILNGLLQGYSWQIALFIVSGIYYCARYVLPGNIMHACAMFPAFAQLLIACGVPAKMGCMMLAFITAYCGYVTPYGSSPCPLTLNTGYIEQKLWWKVGAISGIFYFCIWYFVGRLWWKVTGYW